jgi:hypothetical protein
MTDDQLRPYFEAVNFEDKADADAEAKRLAAYCASVVQCRNGHHRPKADEDKQCPSCGQWTSLIVEAYLS